MKVCVTKGGSIYYLDTERKRVSRLHGVHPPTHWQKGDGEWQKYTNEVCPEQGCPMCFDWTGKGDCTTTTDVVSVSEVKHDG